MKWQIPDEWTLLTKFRTDTPESERGGTEYTLRAFIEYKMLMCEVSFVITGRHMKNGSDILEQRMIDAIECLQRAMKE